MNEQSGPEMAGLPPRKYDGPRPGESAVEDITTTAEKREMFDSDMLRYGGIGPEGEAPELTFRPHPSGNVIVEVKMVKDGEYTGEKQIVQLDVGQIKHLAEHSGDLVRQTEIAPHFEEEFEDEQS